MISRANANGLQFGLDPHVHGYQQHAALVGAGLVDYVPYRQAINNASLRESDAKAAEEWKKTNA